MFIMPKKQKKNVKLAKLLLFVLTLIMRRHPASDLCAMFTRRRQLAIGPEGLCAWHLSALTSKISALISHLNNNKSSKIKML